MPNYRSGSDDLGNQRVDFVWGGMLPMQPAYYDRLGYYLQPGSGMSEYYALGHATVEDFNNPEYYPVQGLKPSPYLDAVDSHKIALNQWQGYPEFVPGTGNWGLTAEENTQDGDYVAMPNIFGRTVKEALASLREMGIPEQYLVETTFAGGSGPYDWRHGSGIATEGVLYWAYKDPNDIIGYHWDGRPWLAREAEGQVWQMYTYPTDWFQISDAPYYCSFVVIQTTDSSKDTYGWWD